MSAAAPLISLAEALGVLSGFAGWSFTLNVALALCWLEVAVVLVVILAHVDDAAKRAEMLGGGEWTRRKRLNVGLKVAVFLALAGSGYFGTATAYVLALLVRVGAAGAAAEEAEQARDEHEDGSA